MKMWAKTKQQVTTLLILSFGLHPAHALNDIDQELYQLVGVFNLRRPTAPTGIPAKIKLGELLFFEKEISGPRNISCSDCHHPNFAFADGLPFSIGEGGTGVGTQRSRRTARLTRRSAPSLWNLQGTQRTQFWDGRVEFDPLTREYRTPELALNGPRPPLQVVTTVLQGSLAAQSLFPMLDPHEMMGLPGTNDISSQRTRPDQWNAIVKRLVSTSSPQSAQRSLQPQKQTVYMQLFRQAFPDVARTGVVHIGHVGNAIQEFIETQLRSPETRFDTFTRGNAQALNPLEKEGMRIFFKKAFCGACHNGVNLSNDRFFNIGSPHLFIGSHNNRFDYGRYELTQFEGDFNTFKTPGLRGVRYTAPYFHNGSMSNLAQVIEHYNHIGRSLQSYVAPQAYSNFYGEPIVADRDPVRNQQRLSNIKLPFLKNGLNLSTQEKQALESFLLVL